MSKTGGVMGKYWLGADEGITFTPSGENTAFTEFADTVPTDMTEHSRTMDPGVFEITGKGVFQIYGYALSALTVIEGDDGLILIDPPEDVEKGKRQLVELRKISDKPIKAVLYSHWHTDHNAGVKAFITQEQADSGEVLVIAHRDFMANIIANSISGDGPIIAVRADYSLGSLLEVGAEGRVNGGLGPDFIMETMSLVTPNTLVDDRLELTVAGVRMEIFWAPSEQSTRSSRGSPTSGCCSRPKSSRASPSPTCTPSAAAATATRRPGSNRSTRTSAHCPPTSWCPPTVGPSRAAPRSRKSSPTTAMRSRTSTTRRSAG